MRLANMEPKIDIAIDRGGTFCDVIARIDGRQDIIFKLLSEDPQNYADAPSEAVRRILEIVESRPIPIGARLDGSSICTSLPGSVQHGQRRNRTDLSDPISILQDRYNGGDQCITRAQRRKVCLYHHERYR